jgi:hypothetical protein
MNANVIRIVCAASAIAFAITVPDIASAKSKSKAVAVTKAVSAGTAPPPAFGYYLGDYPIALDYAQAQALSLRKPYYRHFLYDYCDYRNCTLRWDGTAWVPSWYGPIN